MRNCFQPCGHDGSGINRVARKEQRHGEHLTHAHEAFARFHNARDDERKRREQRRGKYDDKQNIQERERVPIQLHPEHQRETVNNDGLRELADGRREQWGEHPTPSPVGFHPIAGESQSAYSQNMKTLLIAGLLSAGLYLTGCDTTVVDHRHDQGNYGHYDNDQHGYGETRYHTQNVERTNVYQTNVQETNVHRNDVNRTVVKTQSRDKQAGVNQKTSTGNQKASTTKVKQQSDKKTKAKGDEQRGNDKKSESDTQSHQ